MMEKLTDEFRAWGIRLVSLFLVLSFAFIPVRCDASAAAHSIFIAPGMLNTSSGHDHHAAAGSHHTAAKSVPQHSPSMDGASAHQHSKSSQAAHHASSVPDDTLSRLCTNTISSGGDPESQQPVGAILDLPTTSITPDTTALQSQDAQPRLLLFAPAAVLSGIDAPPDAPPPKAS